MFKLLSCRAALVALFVWVPAPIALAESHPSDPRVMEGQVAMFRLDYAKARQIFNEVREQYPESPIGPGMLSVLEWNELLQAANNLVLDDYSTPQPFGEKRPKVKSFDAETRRFHEATTALMNQCNSILAKHPKDPYALYFKGLAYENLAAEAIAITKDNWEAKSKGGEAVDLHEALLKTHPDFVDANVSLAVADYAKANLPWSIRWIAFLLGQRGNERRAFERLQLVIEKGRYRRYDARVLLCLMRAWKESPEQARLAVDILQQLRREFPQNYLLDVNLAAIYEQTKLDDPRSSLRVYDELLASIKSKAGGVKPAEIYYRIGETRLRLREYPEALAAFEKAITSERVEQETAPLAWYNIGLVYERQGAKQKARAAFRKMLEIPAPATIARESSDARRRL